ncbi:Alpha/Beta hydrolase protein [Aspergillus leporis]|jgi:acetyl esterase/lipase|uniref:Alpha/Beta hydrolase protein n=1 Tax=Aspergillus leporis TaxID=41062 RepID=A0A5N5WXP2_9EURO|nr:Alpha/Beta hydrolase protein [Aspergillus leporis]
MSFFFYIYLKFAALVLRTLARLHRCITSNPDAARLIPSRDGGRTIKTHFYRSVLGKTQPGPLLINFHGSGFSIPAHGSDDAFCRYISQQTEYSVLDVQYRLAPEHPFPAAVHDVEDVVNWALNRPQEFDPSRLAISGFSAGANLALVGSAASFPPGTFRSVLAFYPGLDFLLNPKGVAAPEAGGQPIPGFILRIFKQCYLLGGVDPRDPRVCPSFADSERFPRNVLMITAGYDSLAGDGEKLAARLAENPNHFVVSERMEKCNHAWDKLARKGTREWEVRERAYNLAVEMLQR